MSSPIFNNPEAVRIELRGFGTVLAARWSLSAGRGLFFGLARFWRRVGFSQQCAELIIWFYVISYRSRLRGRIVCRGIFSTSPPCVAASHRGVNAAALASRMNKFQSPLRNDVSRLLAIAGANAVPQQEPAGATQECSTRDHSGFDSLTPPRAPNPPGIESDPVSSAAPALSARELFLVQNFLAAILMSLAVAGLLLFLLLLGPRHEVWR